ncbi:MAG: hypothetical protein H6706_12895 [Myxococcales bacterium]|nr:hypothetical protein [Myxococcales bacterium]
MRWLLAALGAVLAVVWIRCVVEGRAELQRAAETRDFESKIEHLQYALRWYAPLGSVSAEAADELEGLARLAEATGRSGEALAAWRRLRGGILAIRHLGDPLGDRLPAVNARIAALMATAQLDAGGATVRGRDWVALNAEHAALLALDPTPAAGWRLAILLGFLGWVASAFAVTRRGFDAELKVRPGPLLRWGASTVICFGIWLLALWRA